MLKEVLKKNIDAFFKVYEEDFKSLPKLPYDEEEPSNLYVGEVDEEEWIQWQYVPVDRMIDFSKLENEYGIHLPQELKEYYNSYYFLELCGFLDDRCIQLDKIDATVDVLDDFRCELDDNGNMITIGTDDYNCSICVKIDSGHVISYDWEYEEESV
ncbi:MAG: SecY-interacting protein Syd, partial [Lachnospiraceae bacterium]|nr:SecY-interacting protein Syd [Lachnospiraceae bacterium]